MTDTRTPTWRLLCLTAAAAHAAESQTPSNCIRRLDGSSVTVTEADSLARTALSQHGVTGAQIAVINDRRVVWSAAFGLRQKSPDLPMHRTTTTWAASITKSVFSTYVMLLVQQGLFDLDQPMVAQLPKPLHEYEAYREKASLLATDTAWARVTPRHLLAHTGGLLNFAQLEPDGRMRIHTPPGSVYRYSGEGINLVQFVIEQQRGATLTMLMQDAIFAPLGMTHTAMVFTPAFEADIADRFGAAGQFLAKTRRNPARAAGSMTTSADDLAAFLIALLDDRIITRRTRNAMLRPAIDIRSLHQFAQALNEPPSAETERVGLAYGVGWGLLTRTPYGPAFFKEGHGDGAQTYAICFPRRQSCMIILTNSENGELAFRTLLEGILGNSVTPWEWEGYTPEYIARQRAAQP
jgi:CubicO group peptidase (beta-lactamase class C family)